MNFRNPIYTEKTQCQDCYKCIRECPVKAIRVESGHAMVVPELCVLCGHCVTICPAGAKRVRDDLSRARQLLTLKDKVIVSLAPSFASEFAGVEPARLIRAIKRLGFFGVSETAIGADLVSAQVAEDFRADGGRKLFLSSACPAAVEYVKRYMGELSPCITDRASPLLAHARFLRETFGADIGVVFVGPCIAKKREADVWDTIDCAITFRDLRRWLSDEGIALAGANAVGSRQSQYFSGASEPVAPGASLGEGDFIPFRAAKGALYPVDGGMIAAVKKYPGAEGINMMSVTGLDGIESTLRGLDPASLAHPLFLEMLSCPGGCVNGPQVASGGPQAIKRIDVLEYAHGARDTLDERRPEMSGTLPFSGASAVAHGEDEIRAALRQVGKLSVEDELNCGSCGYDTCRSFVAAMLEARAEKTMCVSYMRKLAQKKANGLIRAIPSGVVICDASLRIIECNENFARLMGDEILTMFEAKPGMEGADLERITALSRLFRMVMGDDCPDVVEHEIREGKKIFHATVFSIEKGDSACGVIQDVTEPQIQKDRVIRQTKRVINKNLAVVQKIAYLLGENAAETEATLNSIIESFSARDEGE
jgi:iron only hydrogenase large subunit-like protein